MTREEYNRHYEAYLRGDLDFDALMAANKRLFETEKEMEKKNAVSHK